MELAKISGTVTVARMGKREQRWNDPEAHRALRKLYDERITPTGMTQAEFGERHGIGNQSMVHQYLAGRVPLSLEAAGRFAKGLGCHIVDFSPMLADQLKADILPFLGPRSWWKGTAKSIALAFFVAALLPTPQPAHAAFFSPIASLVYYVKSLRRRFWALLTMLYKIGTARVAL